MKLITVFCVIFLLTGCGQSGPLYLPPPPKTAKSMPSNPPATQAIHTNMAPTQTT